MLPSVAIYDELLDLSSERAADLIGHELATIDGGADGHDDESAFTAVVVPSRGDPLFEDVGFAERWGRGDHLNSIERQRKGCPGSCRSLERVATAPLDRSDATAVFEVDLDCDMRSAGRFAVPDGLRSGRS